MDVKYVELCQSNVEVHKQRHKRVHVADGFYESVAAIVLLGFAEVRHKSSVSATALLLIVVFFPSYCVTVLKEILFKA